MKLRNRSEEQLDINLAPLIDVVFLLLIFFMLTTTFEKESRLKVDLHSTESRDDRPLLEPTIITIDQQGVTTLTAYPDVSWESALITLSSDGQEHPLLLRADREAPHGAVVEVMDVARKLRLLNLSIATEPQP
ncbi:MAG TPA: biopolymer transporter ExbD [Gammaproteobacteria bacterium]|jgi:biopolymer transport protein ExbD|nr:biopolymer transporter ExbD [Gammaproteobacteria bacterium]MBT3489105.1 biopolymer transporter ExbD [Gammaproteobacteria bacterium]MBT3718535.1 biopolymer transporter ExbD [Gammaproteobacteria bacterium]MBT3846023.1 biopolymer transporter ExbD [Gammaproteobacteria bacterium]MBT3892732.1 biopolymer transporter ExbD [Gammaproteobacteria bacterium]